MRRLVLISILCLSSCAGLGYQYFTIDPIAMKLRDKDPKNDLDLVKTCSDDEQQKGKCIALLRPVFKAMVEELLELRQKVKDCEKGQPPK